MRALSEPWRVVWALVVATAIGCGGSRGAYQVQESTPPGMEEELGRVAMMHENLESLDESLMETLPDPAVAEAMDPNLCEEVCNLCLNVCELSDRICDVAVRHPNSRLLFDRCLDARVRCKRGARDTDAVCDCSQVELRIRI